MRERRFRQQRNGIPDNLGGIACVQGRGVRQVYLPLVLNGRTRRRGPGTSKVPNPRVPFLYLTFPNDMIK